MKTILLFLFTISVCFGQQKVSSARIVIATDSAARSMTDTNSVMTPKRTNERVMPLYNRYNALRKTLDSLKAITPQKGDKGDPGPIGPSGQSIVGPSGPQGPPGQSIVGPAGANGKDGVSPTITPGTYTTLANGSTPTITNVGTAQNQIWNLAYPMAKDGVNGKDGKDGAPGAVGATGPAGKDGTSAPTSLTAQHTVNLGILAIGGVTSFTVSVPGAQIGMTPIVSVEAGSIPGLTFTAGVQSPGVVKVGVVASLAILAGNKTYYITIPR